MHQQIKLIIIETDKRFGFVNLLLQHRIEGTQLY